MWRTCWNADSCRNATNKGGEEGNAKNGAAKKKVEKAEKAKVMGKVLIEEPNEEGGYAAKQAVQNRNCSNRR